MGLVCEKMTDLVVGEDDGEEEDKEDDEGTEDETVI